MRVMDDLVRFARHRPTSALGDACALGCLVASVCAMLAL